MAALSDFRVVCLVIILSNQVLARFPTDFVLIPDLVVSLRGYLITIRIILKHPGEECR